MHPFDEPITWLTFKLSLREAPVSFWLELGELAASLRQLDGVALAGGEGRSVERDLRAQAMHARAAMDGLVLPLALLKHAGEEGGGRVRGTPHATAPHAYLHAWEKLTNKAHPTTPMALEAAFLTRIHSMVCEGSVEARPGHWRNAPPTDGSWDGVPHQVIVPFVEDLMEWLGSAELAAPSPEQELAYRLLHLLLAELYLAWIRPFGTGHHRVVSLFGETLMRNGSEGLRAAQLLAIALYKSGHEYPEQVRMAAATRDPIPFLTFCVRRMLTELRALQHHIISLQQHGLWRAQLLDLFVDGNDAPTRRQRQILLDLAETRTSIPQNRLPSISPALATLYAGVSEKTLRRDVQALLDADLIQRDNAGYRVDLDGTLVFSH